MAKTIKFKSSIGAWFWYWRQQGKPPSDEGICQPIDIMKAVDRLYERDILAVEHLLVLKKYGSRGRSPEPRLSQERDAWKVWKEAVDRLEVELIKCGIVEERSRK